MEIGIIGLGKMGGGIARRLAAAGHRVFGFDRDPETAKSIESAGATLTAGPGELLERLATPRVVWLMLPAGEITETMVAKLASELESGDVLIEGGNTRYTDTIRRAGELAERGISLLDVGTSGGVHGEREGYCMMVGGEEPVVERLRPIFETLAPAPDRGWGRVGPSGAGHFVKMIHNGIEYGMMQAYAEGFAILDEKSELVEDLEQVAEIWRHGSVVRSWLLDLITSLLAQDAKLEDVAPRVADSGEGRWTVAEAIDLDVSAPVITLALLARLRSRDDRSYADRFLAALRNQFGGHSVTRLTDRD